MQAIYGYAELLEEGIHGKLNKDQLADVVGIQEGQHQVLALLNSILLRVKKERLAAGQVAGG